MYVFHFACKNKQNVKAQAPSTPSFTSHSCTLKYILLVEELASACLLCSSQHIPLVPSPFGLVSWSVPDAISYSTGTVTIVN